MMMKRRLLCLRSKTVRVLVAFTVCCFYLFNLSFCCSLNDEGVALLRLKERIESSNRDHDDKALSNWIDVFGVETPCSWSGVECSHGFVHALNLKDLCLKGTLPPDIGNLVHVKSIILRNNSFYGIVPEEIANLKELEILDIGYNNFSGQLPCRLLGNNLSMALLLIDNNELLESIHHRIYELQKLSEDQVKKGLSSTSNQGLFCDGLLIARNSKETRNVAQRKLLQVPSGRRSGWRFRPPPDTRPPAPIPDPAPAPAPAPEPLGPSPSPPILGSFPPEPSEPPPSPPILGGSLPSPPVTPETSSAPTERTRGNRNQTIILSATIGGPLLVVLVIISILFYKSCKVVTVTPWASGLSGQLQRALITGVPKLKRAELEGACEGFSNVIGSTSVGTLYKGTLSSGVEIAVESITVASAKDWSKDMESQFRKKIDTTSKVNHKNFVSLLGYCEEAEPFTRMLVFEYAPNGTLFEHLHIQEAEHLDWDTRLRIAMGMAYCLDHMHQLSPIPLPHKNLTSASIYLTEDYAAKVSDFVLPNGAASERQPSLESNVYDFGVVLFEMVTGKLPYSTGSVDASGDDWASEYLKGAEKLNEVVDPTLRTYREDQLQMIGSLLSLTAQPNAAQRPSMKEVCEMLRAITRIGPDAAVPKLSPLWWAELEILSNEGG